ncbi:terminase family protein [Escherichia coli]|nr:terminase family protein [Escherichia coli]
MASAQSYTGNFYFDRFFSGSSRFAELAQGRLALWQPSADCGAPTFSTPSTETHEAYAYWNGDRWNEKKRQRINASVFLWTGKRCITGLSALTGRGGKLSRWKMWLITPLETHRILTRSRDENTEDEFRNLYMCEFVREGESAFNLEYPLIGRGVVDTTTGKDWKTFLLPARWGNRPVMDWV